MDNPIAIIRSKDLTVDRLGDNECNGWQSLVVPVVDAICQVRDVLEQINNESDCVRRRCLPLITIIMSHQNILYLYHFPVCSPLFLN